MKNEADSNNLN